MDGEATLRTRQLGVMSEGQTWEYFINIQSSILDPVFHFPLILRESPSMHK